jgi:muramoyltetrapeptide carboxypeptidase
MTIMPQTLKPARLQPGQTIGILAPASHLDETDRIELAIETVQSLGFGVRQSQHLRQRHGYFAGDDRQRAADLNAFFADDTIDGMICLTGGWGSSRTLPYLDFSVIRSHPKVFMGYSDITALLNGIHAHTGLVTFHGPLADQTFTPYTLEAFTQVVMQAQANIHLGAPPPFESRPGQVARQDRVWPIVGGKGRGRLLGGNLTLLSHLVGTPYLPDFSEAILFLEDVTETVYRIDRMLTQLRLSGALRNLSGLVFGKFTDCPPSSGHVHQFTLAEVLADFAQSLGVPAVRGLMIGHVENMATLPVGCQAELDADAGTLQLLEPGVR